ncbi:hypothetical protein HNV12_30145, partial [Methanococcoides sp. SA1]|nr:hypothetical protein [Methanococcoides sp. SA1]
MMNNRLTKINFFVPEKLSHIMWKDKQNDSFILTKFGEIYRYDNENMQLISWSKNIYDKIVKAGLLGDLDYTDDGLFLGRFQNDD